MHFSLIYLSNGAVQVRNSQMITWFLLGSYYVLSLWPQLIMELIKREPKTDNFFGYHIYFPQQIRKNTKYFSF